MSNAERIEIVDGIYHVNTRGVTGLKPFPDYRHRQKFFDLFSEECERSDWTCFGYSIVGTHYHVVIRINKLTLSRGFQRLNSRYARWFNKNHGRSGAMWQSRFHDTIIKTDSHFLELLRYLAYNATRANLADAPADWPYCNYGALIGAYASDPLVPEEEILCLFSRDPRRARELLREFVEEADPRERRRQTMLRRGSELVT
jgi:REP element-mobilizing transposase RayT